MLDFSRLRPPTSDGEVLVEPSHARLSAVAEGNRALLDSYVFAVLDTDVQTLRRELRRSLCAGCEAPTVMTGHQPEFIHAGVWAKHVVASRLAEAFDGRAINLVVDNDAPKRTVIETPAVVQSQVRVKQVRYARLPGGASHESIPRLAKADVRYLEATVRRHLGDLYDRSSMAVYFAAMFEADGAADWVEQMVGARRAVERDFGVGMIEQRVSRSWFGPLLADLMMHHGRFMECYNGALSEYRSANRVRSANRPVPDLVCEGSRCELPVWVYRLGEPRRRLLVERAGDRMILYADSDRMGEVSLRDLGRWDRAREALRHMDGYLFRPRALSLTLWARVFVGDLFIHGIGGAKYDRITDGLIRRYYGVEPPAMACVSATLRMQLPHGEVDEAALRRARARVRDVRYNPQRHVRQTPETTALSQARRRAVAEAVALRTGARRDRVRRRAAFDRIREASAKLLEVDPSPAAAADAQLAEIAERLAQDRVARRRDFFFAMHDRVRLERLRDKLTDAIAHRTQ